MAKNYLDKGILCLPGKDSPKQWLFDYSMSLYPEKEEFWSDSYLIVEGCSVEYYRTNIKAKIEEIEEKITYKNQKGKVQRGIKDVKIKNFFNEEWCFFWICSYILDEKCRK